MKTVAIVQARLGSTRLPGKVLLNLGGQTVLGRVVNRVRRFELVDDVVVATSTLDEDDAVVEECRLLGVASYRGSAPDVLDRFVGAARDRDADICVRITADCPLIDPGVSDSIIGRFVNSKTPVDYASNKIPQSFPRGLDTEVFTREALEAAARDAKAEYQRAHVTPFLYQNPDRFTVVSILSEVDRADWRWTIDTPEDFEFVRRIYEYFAPLDNFDWTEVVSLIERKPELMSINHHVQQKSLEQG